MYLLILLPEFSFTGHISKMHQNVYNKLNRWFKWTPWTPQVYHEHISAYQVARCPAGRVWTWAMSSMSKVEFQTTGDSAINGVWKQWCQHGRHHGPRLKFQILQYLRTNCSKRRKFRMLPRDTPKGRCFSKFNTQNMLLIQFDVKKKSSRKTQAIQPWRFMSCEFTVPLRFIAKAYKFCKITPRNLCFHLYQQSPQLCLDQPGYPATPLLSERKSKVLTPGAITLEGNVSMLY